MALTATLLANAAPAHDDRALEHWLNVCDRPQLDYWIQLCTKVQARDPSMNSPPEQGQAAALQADTRAGGASEATPQKPQP
jgi:hypothetical protein